MNTRILSIIGLVILGAALFFGGLFWGRSQVSALGFYPGSMMNGGLSARQDGPINTPSNGSYGMMDGSFGIANNGMMGSGYGMMESNADMSGGYGMMEGDAGMMGGYGGTNSGYDMMGGMMGNASGLVNVDPLTLEEATTAVTDYLASLNNDNLELGEIMIFSNHAYAQILDAATGQGAFEMLVDAATRTVFPEPGPNMMWNSEYGMMGMMGSGMMNGQYGSDMMSGQYDSDMMGSQYGSGMMGGQYGSDMMGDYGYAPDAETSVTGEQAVELAQTYLDDYLPGKTADEHAATFPGYYTLHILEDGQTVGMLSVNAATGQVFPHHWHGDFIEMAE